MCGDEHARLCGENVEKMNMHVSGNQMNGDADKTTASRGGRQVQGNVLDFFPEKVFPEKFLQKISDLDSTTKMTNGWHSQIFNQIIAKRRTLKNGEKLENALL